MSSNENLDFINQMLEEAEKKAPETPRPEADTVQVLVNKETKILAIMPCPENARDDLRQAVAGHPLSS